MKNEYEELYCPEILKRTTDWPRIEIDEITYNFHNLEIRMKGSVDDSVEIKHTDNMEVSFNNVDFTRNIRIFESKQSNDSQLINDNNTSLEQGIQGPSFCYHAIIEDIASGKKHYYDLVKIYETDVISESMETNSQKFEREKTASNSEDNPFDIEFEDAPIETTNEKTKFEKDLEIIVPIDEDDDPFDTNFEDTAKENTKNVE